MSEPQLTLIAAIAANGVIGADNGMPWHIPGELGRFKRLTLDRPVLMGRLTLESIGRPLPRRHNIVLSREVRSDRDSGVTWVTSLADAIAAANGAETLMVMGGAEIYALALPFAKRMLLTHIEADYEGDTCFPSVDWSRWYAAQTERVAASDDVPAHRFVTWVRRSG